MFFSTPGRSPKSYLVLLSRTFPQVRGRLRAVGLAVGLSRTSPISIGLALLSGYGSQLVRFRGIVEPLHVPLRATSANVATLKHKPGPDTALAMS